MNAITAANAVCRQIDALKGAYPEIFADEEFAIDVIEGETDCFELIERLADQVALFEKFIDAIDARIDELKSRKDRFRAGRDAYRDGIARLMDASSLNRLPLATATLSVRAGSPRVCIIDEDQVPETYRRVKVEIDKAALGEALRAGLDVPGATLNNGPPTLTIRRN